MFMLHAAVLVAASINLNEATVEILTQLPGIGLTRARAIVFYRENHGPFKTVDELLCVDGIGPKLLSKLKTQLCL